jgi:hypothetical protein
LKSTNEPAKLAAKPTAEFDAKWSRFVIDGKTFTQLVYSGV